jgi:hypothetical protein
MQITCESCGAGLTARDRLAGRSVACPRCGQPVSVPSAAEEPPEGFFSGFSMYWGIEVIFGWVSLLFYIAAAMRSGRGFDDSPSAAWLITILVAMAVGRLDAIDWRTRRR